MVKDTHPRFAVAEVQLSYSTKIKPSERLKISSSKDTFALLKSFWETGKMELQEEFKVLLLNRGGRFLGIYHCSSGGAHETIADPKLIFAVALKANASSIVIAHNHPSGSTKPSKMDLAMSKRLVDSGLLLGITVLDHLIITSEEYFSFADEGLI